MYYKSKKISLLILGVTALFCSRTMFFFFDDPEGPNLLIVSVVALGIFFMTLPVYMQTISAETILGRFSSFMGTGSSRLLNTIVLQVLITAVLYFCLYL
jgi:hypothetical protein